MAQKIILVLYVLLVQTRCFSPLEKVSNYSTIISEILVNNEQKELQINDQCKRQLVLFAENLDHFWALKMVDASAKVPSGVMTFNIAWLGNFDECLEIESSKKDVKGNYCLTSLASKIPITHRLRQLQVINEEHTKLFNKYLKEMQPAFLPSIGLCIPDKCNATDVKNVLHMVTPSIPFSVTCQTKDDINKPLNTGAILTICYFGVFVVLMTASTIYDIYRNKKTKPHPLLVAFSTYSNSKKLFKMDNNSDDLLCLNGIRFLSMLWVILGHSFLATLLGPLVNFLEMLLYFRTTRSLFFANGVYSVDTFFVVTGFLVVYSFMRSHCPGRKFNIIRFYFHRYIRLTPALVPLLLSTIFLMKYLGSGPFYPQIEQFSAPCRKYWWSTVLYVENYVNIESRCLGHTWYLNVDWQLYLIAPIFLPFLPKRPLIGLSLMLCATIGAMVSSFIVTWNNKLESLETNFHGDLQEYIEKFYMKTHTRAATWFIGAFVGYILGKMHFQLKLTSLQLPKWLVILNWIIVLTTIPVCIFAGVSTLNGEEYRPYSNAFYNAFTRPAWAICIGWIIFACSIGYGGLINTFLSLPIFQVLNRFIYSMYLLHHTILYVITLSQKQPGYFSLFNVAYSFWGIFAISLGLSVFWVLAFESPMPLIEKYIFDSIARRYKNKQQVGNARSSESLVSTQTNVTDISEP